MTDTYNGWVNRETWCAALHLSNDARFEAMCNELAKEALAEAERSPYVQEGVIERGHAATHNMAAALKDMVETWAEELRMAALGHNAPGNVIPECIEMVLDVGSLYRVEWADVARDYIESAIENEGD